MRAAVAILVLAGVAGTAHAHVMSDGHLVLAPDGTRLTGTLDVGARDLHDALGLDPDGDGRITWGEVTAAKRSIADYVVGHLSITSEGERCALATGELGMIDRSDGAHVAIALVATCADRPLDVSVDYRLVFELDAQHRGLVQVGASRGIARADATTVRLRARDGAVARLAAVVPGGGIALAVASGLLVFGLGAVVLRRRRPIR